MRVDEQQHDNEERRFLPSTLNNLCPTAYLRRIARGRTVVHTHLALRRDTWSGAHCRENVRVAPETIHAVVEGAGATPALPQGPGGLTASLDPGSSPGASTITPRYHVSLLVHVYVLRHAHVVMM